MFQTTCVYIARSSERLLYDSCLDQLSQVVVAKKAKPSPSASQAWDGRPSGTDRSSRVRALPATTVRLRVICSKGPCSSTLSLTVQGRHSRLASPGRPFQATPG